MNIKKTVAKVTLLSATILPTVAQLAQPVMANENEPVIVSIKKKEDIENLSVEELTKEIAALEEANEKLNEKIKKDEERIKDMSLSIAERMKKLAEQAKDIQTSSRNSSVIESILSSKTVTETLKKFSAMTTLANANNKALKQLNKDKAELEKEQKANQENITAVVDNTELLKVRKAELELAEEQARLKAEEEKKKQEEERLAQEEEKAKETGVTETAEIVQIRQEIAQQDVVIAEAQANVSTVTEKVETVRNDYQTYQNYSSGVVNHNGSGNMYPWGQCTWGAKELAPWAGTYWGNGAQWAYSAQADGFTVGETPQVGAIAVWNDGGYGHVAVVVEVQSSTMIRVMESNVNGNMSIADHRGWFNPQVVQGYVSYIYPPA